jgi:hypothetical protein
MFRLAIRFVMDQQGRRTSALPSREQQKRCTETAPAGVTEGMPVDTIKKHHSPAARFFRNPKTDEVVVWQMPNLPLWLFFIASALRRLLHPAGTLGVAIAIVAGISLVVWAVLEVVKGESPFRRVLGAVVLAVSLVGFLTGR